MLKDGVVLGWMPTFQSCDIKLADWLMAMQVNKGPPEWRPVRTTLLDEAILDASSTSLGNPVERWPVAEDCT